LRDELHRLRTEKGEAAMWFDEVETKTDKAVVALGSARAAITPPPGTVYDDNGFALIKIGELRVVVKALDALLEAISAKNEK
jgi:hypothetical protein